MKKTWTILCLAALLTLPLAGCGGDRTGSDTGTASPSPSPSQTVPSPNTMPDLDDGTEDLAGSDGIVGGAGGENDASGAHSGTGTNGTTGTGTGTTGGSGAGNTGNDAASGSQSRSAVERVGDGIRDTLDDVGDAARRMGQDAKNVIER